MTAAAPPAPAARLTFLPDILEEHVAELGFLWRQRDTALRSPRYTMRELFRLEDRIEAHAHGIRAVGEQALPLLEARLAGDDPELVFGAAYGLLRLGTTASVSLVGAAFDKVGDGTLDAVRRALCFGSAQPLLGHLQYAAGGDPSPRTAIAIEAIAYHADYRPDLDRFTALLTYDENVTQASAWRTAANLALPLDAKLYAAGMRDDDPLVRRAALGAAAWTGVRGVLALARRAADDPVADSADAFALLAALATAADLPRIERIARTADLGPDRFDLVAAYGSPRLIPLLLDAMTDADPAAAAAAGNAFTAMTGHDVASTERATAAPKPGAPPDEFDAEFLDDVLLPDAARARALWERDQTALGHAVRLCRGIDVTQLTTPAEVDAVADMRVRWDFWLRRRFAGAWDGSPMSLAIFPQNQ
jgi:uncharacterized protein (TIGR02270 family)